MQRLSAFATLLLVTACGATPPPVEAPAPTPPPVDPAPVAPVPTPAEPVPEPLIIDLARIEGQTPAGVLEYLGTPSLVRRDENVQVMIFETETCVVEVIFYEPDNGDHFRARRVNARTTAGHDTDLESCVRQWLTLQ